MRRLGMVLLLVGLAGPAMASLTGNTPTAKEPGNPYVNPDPPIRVTGDTVGDPFVLPGLGTVSGTTAGFTDDYDEMCPYGSNSPDVVYAFTPPGDILVDIDLCYSSYDTKVYVYDSNPPHGGLPIACNDDYWSTAPCFTYSSKLERLGLAGGHTYYIVVDGYGGQFGEYSMDVTETVPPVQISCPDGALVENEPPCADGYVDNHNGGCGSHPEIWQAINPQTAGCAVMCGKSCTYVFEGSMYRDTDWFESFGTGAPVVASCTAEFPLQFMILYGTDCADLAWVIGTGAPGVAVTLTWTVAAGEAVWFWVANQTFTGWPESDYVLSVCGIQDPPLPPGACCNTAGDCIVATPEACAAMGGIFQGNPTCDPNPCLPVPNESRSWGALKNLYR